MPKQTQQKPPQTPAKPKPQATWRYTDWAAI